MVLNRGALRSAIVHQWTPGIRPCWDIKRTEAALLQHMQGNFEQSALFAEAMYADDEYSSSLDAAVNKIVGSEFVLQPINGPDGEPLPDSQAVSDAMLPGWETSFPEAEIGNLLRWFLQLGVAIAYQSWDTSSVPWVPHLHVLHPQFLYFDHARMNPQTGQRGCYMYSSEAGTEVVTPGDGKWVLLADGRESWMRSGVRALAVTWLIKQYANRDWQRYNERHGLPLLKAMVPMVSESDDKDQFFKAIRRLGSDTTAMLPTHIDQDGAKFDLDLLEARDNSWETFKACVERSDRKFQIYFGGTNTNELIGTAGSRATSESGRGIASERAAERERKIVTPLREQLVKPWIAVNMTGTDPHSAPWPHYVVEGKQDQKQAAEVARVLADTAVQFKVAGLEVVNIAEIGADIGLELRPVDDPAPAPDESLAALESTDKATRLARGGLLAVDRFTDKAASDGQAAINAEAELIRTAIRLSTSREDLQDKLTQLFDSYKPRELARVYERAGLMSILAGVFTVRDLDA